MSDALEAQRAPTAWHEARSFRCKPQRAKGPGQALRLRRLVRPILTPQLKPTVIGFMRYLG